MSRLVAIIGTSGSISGRLLDELRAETAAAMDDGAAEALTVLYTDTGVQGIEGFTRGDEVKLHPKGGGGTDF